MIKIAIVEDEEHYRNQLKEYLTRYGKENGCSFDISVYTDGDEIALDYKYDYDIILMDIKMQFMDGMTAAEKIREKDDRVLIMFITNMTNYAIRGYEVDALDYILKPITYFAFAKRMERAVGRLARREEKASITLQITGGVQKVYLEDLHYIDSDAHLLNFYTSKGKYSSYLRMQDMEEALIPYGFFRINRGYMVNLKFVDGVEDNCALVDGQMLLISRTKKKEFMEALTKYLRSE